MSLRRLDKSDAEALRALWAEGLRVRPEAFLLTEEELSAVSDERFVAGLKACPTFGAFSGGTLVGFVRSKTGGPHRLRHTADIGPLYVTQSQGRRGLGRALMQAALDDLTADGVQQVELSVDDANTSAYALYLSMGFKVFGRRPRSVIIDGCPRNDLLMIRALDGVDLVLENPVADH